MICSFCNKGKLISTRACGGEVVYRCELCNKEIIKKYDPNSTLDYLKDNYDSPEEWAKDTIEAHSYHGEIPKEDLDRLKACKTWDDVLILEKEVVPHLTR